MKLRKIISISIFLIFAFPFFASCASTSKTSSPNLQRVAVKSEWPESSQNISYEILLESFLIRIPAKVKRISTVNDSLLVFNENGSVLHFSPITAEDLVIKDHPSGVTINSKITVSEAGQIPFEKTINDPVPNDPVDFAVWQDAMENKKEIFGNSNLVFKSEKNNLKAYYYESPVPPLGNYASIHDLNRPNLFLHVAVQNLSFEEFKKIIGSIKLKD